MRFERSTRLERYSGLGISIIQMATGLRWTLGNLANNAGIARNQLNAVLTSERLSSDQRFALARIREALQIAQEQKRLEQEARGE